MFRKALIIGIIVLTTITSTIPSFAVSAEATATTTGGSASSTKVEGGGGTVSSTTETLENVSTKIKKDDAKEIALKSIKEYFGLDIDENQYESSIKLRQSYRVEGSYVWQFRWNKYDETSESSVRLDLDANSGKIQTYDYYHYFDDLDNQSSIALISFEEAKEAAEKLLKKMNPEEFNELEYVDYSGIKYRRVTSDYSFMYQRIVNGIKFSSDSVDINVNGIDGTISSYNCSWHDDIDFPFTDGVLSEEQAYSKLKENVQLTLKYIPVINPYLYDNKLSELKLIYSPDYSNSSMIDAKTGDSIDYNGKTISEQVIKDITKSEKKELLASSSDTQTLDREIDSEKAAEIIAKILEDLFSGDYEIDNINYNEDEDDWDSNGNKSWSASFEQKNNTMNYSGYIAIDALTGQLSYVDNYRDFEHSDEDFTPALSWEEAYDKAVKVISEYMPEKINEIKTEQKYYPSKYYIDGKVYKDRNYNFNFHRIVNGISYLRNSIDIVFDAETGEIESIYVDWDDNLEFPSTENILTREDAEKIFYELHKPALSYILIDDDESSLPSKISLRYSLTSNNIYGLLSNIDAVTGKLVNYNGIEVEEDSQNDLLFNNKIAGHWAEKELSILSYQGIIDSGNFEFDKEITILEFIKMLVNAKEGYNDPMYTEDLKFNNIEKDSETYSYLQIACSYGLIDNVEGDFDKDELITREDLAVYIVDLLKYNNIAGKSDIFKLDFEDASEIDQNKIGYLAICNAFNIINGDNGKIRPKDNATMVEAAVAVYRALCNVKK